MNSADTTAERATILRELLDDAAKKIGGQRETIRELTEALNSVTTEYESTLYAMGIHDGREVTRIARNALAKSGAAK